MSFQELKRLFAQKYPGGSIDYRPKSEGKGYLVTFEPNGKVYRYSWRSHIQMARHLGLPVIIVGPKIEVDLNDPDWDC